MKLIAILLVGVWGTAGLAAAPADPVAGPAAAATQMGPAPSTEITPEVRSILQMLHDRKDTLKDFTATIDYRVTTKTGDTSSKTGTLSFLMDPVKGAIFSVAFDRSINNPDDPDDRVVYDHYRQEIIFDGVDLTTKDYGLDGKSRLYTRSTMLPPGAKPGEAVTLNGALPLPIGIAVDDVVKNFDASQKPSKDANLPVLVLVPRNKAKFDYSKLEVAVDLKQQLPVKLVSTALDGATVTTISFDHVKINTGEAKMLDSATPAKDGWKDRG